MKKYIIFSGSFAASIVSMALAFAITPVASAQVACPAGYRCVPKVINCPTGYVCTPNNTSNSTSNTSLSGASSATVSAGNSGTSGSGAGYIPGFGPSTNGTDSTAPCCGAAPTAEQLANSPSIGSSPDLNPTSTTNGSTVNVTTYYANSDTKNTYSYLTTIPNNVTTNAGNTTYTSYGVAGINYEGTTPCSTSTCYQAKSTYTLTDIATPTAKACPSGTSCIDSLGFPIKSGRLSAIVPPYEPTPKCTTEVSFETANRIASALQLSSNQSSALISPATLHVAAIAGPFGGTSMNTKTMTQTYSQPYNEVVFDLCLDSGYVPNTPVGLNASQIITMNTPATQYVLFDSPNTASSTVPSSSNNNNKSCTNQYNSAGVYLGCN